MTKKRIRITDGGIALPLGNNTFLMRGRLHSQGGIGIGNGGKNDIEVEDGEVVKFNKDNIQVLSDQPMLNGISPANALLAGGDFNKIFKAQQSINGNYRGSYAENGSKREINKENKTIKRIIQERLAKNLYPVGYDHILKRVFESVILNKKNEFRQFIDDSQSIDDKNRLALLSKALDNADTGVKFEDYFQKSKYKPSKSNNSDIDYYTIKRSPYFTIDEFLNLEEQLGRYTIDKGMDKDGEYYSIYDIWDLNPLGSTNKGDFTNITKPFEIYDRIYEYDDAYDLINKWYKEKIKYSDKNNKIIVGDNHVKISIKKSNDDYFKNGGQINMKLKNKNKQDITDIVMNEILPHSTGKRKKFLWGGSEWSLLGNIGTNLLSTLGQGIAGSIAGNKLAKMYKNLKRESTYVPVAREHIDTRVNIEPQLTGNKEAEEKLIRNAQVNTSNSKVAREQMRQAVASRIQADHTVYGDKLNRETQLRNAEAELQTRYNLVDNQNIIRDRTEQNDFDIQKSIGIANAEASKAQTWGASIAQGLKGVSTTISDYTTMTNDLLKSNNPYAYAEYMRRNYGRFMNPDGTLKDKYKGNTRIENFYNKNLAPLFGSNNSTPQIIGYDGGLLT